jgi:hypothetical protein
MHHFNLLQHAGPFYTVGSIRVTGLLGPLWLRLFVAYARLDPEGAEELMRRLCSR